jgi:hypothetical protein
MRPATHEDPPNHRRVRTDVTLCSETESLTNNRNEAAAVRAARRASDIIDTRVAPAAPAPVTYHGRKESFITAPSKQPQDAIWERLMMRGEVQEVRSRLLVIL